MRTTTHATACGRTARPRDRATPRQTPLAATPSQPTPLSAPRTTSSCSGVRKTCVVSIVTVTSYKSQQFIYIVQATECAKNNVIVQWRSLDLCRKYSHNRGADSHSPTRHMRVEFRIDEFNCKPTRQSDEFFPPLTDLSYFLASCFLTWRVKILVYSPVWRVSNCLGLDKLIHTPGHSHTSHTLQVTTIYLHIFIVNLGGHRHVHNVNYIRKERLQNIFAQNERL
jgi:hypothetical protein